MTALKVILETRTCPKCEIGMVKEIRKGFYECERSLCGEIFDFSDYSDLSLPEVLTLIAKK